MRSSAKRAPITKQSPIKLSVQTILYNTEPESVSRALELIVNSVAVAKRDWNLTYLTVSFGDASPRPVLNEAWLAKERSAYEYVDLRYEFFGENLGTSAGHNRLMGSLDHDVYILRNPDVGPEGAAIARLLEVFLRDDVGIAEPRQSPIEHPKEYDAITGETSWASGAFTVIHRDVLKVTGGYDQASFFLYCDDVDLSWRARMAGFSVVHQPAAIVYHSKRLTPNGKWSPTDAEKYYSAEAALIMAHKWHSSERVRLLLETFLTGSSEPHRRAAFAFQTRKEQRTLPKPLANEQTRSWFEGDDYSPRRYSL